MKDGLSGSAARNRYQQSLKKRHNKSNNHLALQHRYGVITEVHETNKNLVKIQYKHGNKKAGFVGGGTDGVWVPLEGGALLETLIGQPRVGMSVIVEFEGYFDRNPTARIIDIDDASPFVKTLPLNSKQLSMYRLLAPGLI